MKGFLCDLRETLCVLCVSKVLSSRFRAVRRAAPAGTTETELTKEKGSQAVLLASLFRSKALPHGRAPVPFDAQVRYGCGVGVGCGCGSRLSVGGAGLLVSGVVVASSGVGWRRFKVGRPGVPSSAPPMAPLEDARALDNLNRRFFTR